ncbi:MAG: fibronectin type III domain-containing protein [Caulobacterales bacterium]|nr:fibronectin type III domain-containing protein [Caulobacterales bacterium]
MRVAPALAATFCAALAACSGGGGGGDGGGGDDPGGGTGVSVTASWDIPVQRTDGSSLSLSELDGYEIRYSVVGQSDFTAVIVNDQTADAHTMTGLAPGSYEFSIAAVETDGSYGVFAGPVTVTVP